MHITFDQIDGFVRVYDGTKCIVLILAEKYDFIYNRTRYLKGVRSGTTYIISHNHAKTKVDSYDSLPQEKTLTFHNVFINIKSVWNKDQNHYYCNIFLEKYFCELPRNNDNK